MPNPITLKQKIGQMIIAGFKGTTLTAEDPIVQSIKAQHLGGVILFDHDYQANTEGRNIQSPQQVKALTQQLQTYAMAAAKDKKNDLSHLIISIDYEGGRVNRLKEKYGFPPTKSAADIGKGTFEDAQKEAEQMAVTLQEIGINLNFAPVLDVNVNLNNPVIAKLNRSFSADPKKVSEYAAIFAKTYHDHRILCAYKHFPGHGSSAEDTHSSPFVDVTETWKSYELDPYQALFEKADSCAMVMTAHVVNRNYDSKPATLSASIINDLLRHTLHFKGVVVTDDMQMKAISEQYGLADAVTLAVNAGADMLIFGNQLVATPQDPEDIVDIIYEGVMSGQISEKRIDEAYERIRVLKAFVQ